MYDDIKIQKNSEGHPPLQGLPPPLREGLPSVGDSEPPIENHDSKTSARYQAIRCLLEKLVIVKLDVDNATAMGYKDPKSLIGAYHIHYYYVLITYLSGIRPGMSFLDLAIKQVEYLNTRYNVNVPLILIASFRTQQALREKLTQFRSQVL